MDDEQIIELFWERREQAIEEVSGKYGRYCLSIASNILGSREDSEECVNDAYLNLWKSIPPHRPEKLSAFLGKIVRNLALNKWENFNAQKRNCGQVPAVLDEMHECVPSHEETDGHMDAVELSEIINRFLSALETEKRRIFIRRYWYMDSIKEIAMKHNMSESKVKMSLLRSRKQLRAWLEKEGVNV